MSTTARPSVEVYTSITKAPETVILDLINASESAYAEVARRTKRPVETVHAKSGLCVDIVGWMGQTLCDMGTGYRAGWRETTINANYHAFMSLQPPGDDIRYLADPSWQQFLQDGVNPEFPKMLLGTSAEIAAQAALYGLNERQIAAWNVR